MRIKKSIITIALLMGLVCVQGDLISALEVPNEERIVLQQESETTDTTSDTVEVEEEPIPRGRFASGWSLMNVLCCIITILLSVVLLVSKSDKEPFAKEDKKLWAKGFSVIAALDAVVVFIFTQDMTLPMRISDKWTVSMVLIVFAQMVILGIGFDFFASKKKIH